MVYLCIFSVESAPFFGAAYVNSGAFRSIHLNFPLYFISLLQLSWQGNQEFQLVVMCREDLALSCLVERVIRQKEEKELTLTE